MGSNSNITMHQKLMVIKKQISIAMQRVFDKKSLIKKYKNLVIEQNFNLQHFRISLQVVEWKTYTSCNANSQENRM